MAEDGPGSGAGGRTEAAGERASGWLVVDHDDVQIRRREAVSDGNMQSKQSTTNNEACVLVRRLGHKFRVLSFVFFS